MSKKIAIFLIFLIFSLVSVVPVEVTTTGASDAAMSGEMNTSSMATARILIDESHCATDTDLWTPANASRFGSFLMGYGHTVITNFDASLDSGILDTFDIFMLFFPQVELTAAEVTAIEDFVDNGGHLLLVGVDNRPTVSNYTSQPLNAISETYGITFNEDARLGRAVRSDGDIIDHQITYSVDSVVGRAGNFLQSCTLTLASPAVSLCTINNLNFAAYAEVGDAKIVASGGAAPFLELGEDSWLISADDHYQLCLNIVDWMLGNEERVVEVPEEHIITVGNGPDLNSTEVEEYQMFVGIIHEHTTYSDGRSTAQEMTLAAINAQLDFLVMTDHSWENPSEVGIHGGLKCEEYVLDYELDTLIVVGAELSNGPHVVGFPLTENIWSGDMQEKVDGAHDQGGIAILAHPLLGQGYIEPWTNYDEYGYDAFEVINDIYMYGEGESAYLRPFVAASDSHFAGWVGRTLTAVFVKDPTGPNGTLSQDDIVDAVLNRRVVGLCRNLHTVIGEVIWVNRYLEIRDDAETAIEDAESVIDAAITSGATASLATAYLNDAISAIYNQNPSAALAKAQMASSEFILGIDIEIEDGGFGLLNPGEEGATTITLTNDLDSAVSLDIIPFFESGIDLDQTKVTVEAATESTGLASITGTAWDYGNARSLLNLRNFNSEDYVDPIILVAGGFIANVSATSEQVEGGYNATIDVFYNRGDTEYIASAKVTYDDGSGETTTNMKSLGDRYSAILGPYPAGTNITYVITITDKLGYSFVFEDGYIVLAEAGLPPESVTLLVIAGAGIGIVALVVVLVKFRK